MPLYSVEVEGENCLMEIDGTFKKLGFITIRVVDAPDSASAKRKAMQQVEDSSNYRELLSRSESRPILFTSDIEEITVTTDDNQSMGLIFYDMEE